MRTSFLPTFQDDERERVFSPAERPRLSRREHEVLSLLEEGLTTAEIAARLFIAQVRVRSHIASVCKKLRVPDRRAVLQELRSVRAGPA